MSTVGHRDITTEVLDLSKSARAGAFSLELRELARSRLAEEYTREELLDAFEEAALALRKDEREEEEDEVLEVMVELEGWCSPSARL